MKGKLVRPDYNIATRIWRINFSAVETCSLARMSQPVKTLVHSLSQPRIFTCTCATRPM